MSRAGLAVQDPPRDIWLAPHAGGFSDNLLFDRDGPEVGILGQSFGQGVLKTEVLIAFLLTIETDVAKSPDIAADSPFAGLGRPALEVSKVETPIAVGPEGAGNIDGSPAFMAAIERLAFGSRGGDGEALFGQLGRLHRVKDTVIGMTRSPNSDGEVTVLMVRLHMVGAFWSS